MSDVFYPVGLIARQVVTRLNRVTRDEFEDGTTASRLNWSAYNFKRRFEVQHLAMTLAEWRALRSFHAQRSGGYDSFWFRDNVNRGGNAKVRFAAPLPEDANAAALTALNVTLDEVAPIRALPELDEMTTAAGSAPYFWGDANRERVWSHQGTTYLDGTGNTHDFSGNSRDLLWVGPTASVAIGGTTSQYQYYAGDGIGYARRVSDASLGAQPAVTIFLIARAPTSSTRQVLFAVGNTGTGESLGLEISSSNYFQPATNGTSSGTWTNCKQSNGTADTWRSFALVAAAASNSITMYTNAASLGADTETRNTYANKIELMASIIGAAPLLTGGRVAHALAFNAALSAGQIAAVHNLLGYQYGLATV